MIEHGWRDGPCWWRIACESSSFSIAQTLLDLGVVRVDDEIVDAIHEGDIAKVRRLFAEYPQMLHRGFRGGASPWLSTAIRARRLGMAEALLELGVDVNQGKHYAPDENALFTALVIEDLEMLRFLLERGANAKQYKAVISAITGKHALEMVKLLDKHGADLNAIYMNELIGEPMNALSTAIDWGQEDVAEYLRSRGCVLPSAVEREDEPITAEAVPSLDEEVIEYFRQHLGSVQKLSLIEIVPSGIPIAIHFVPASPERNHITLFTAGMSSHPMRVPEGMEQYARAELFIQLPADWKYQDYSDPNYAWPQKWLRSMAQYPSHHDTWLGGPVTIVANDDPPQPLAPNTRFTSLLLMAERTFTSHDGHTIQLYRMSPLYTEERELEIREGIGALLRAFDQRSIPFIVDLNRRSVAI